MEPEIDTTVPHSARVWNYWLGGTDNYPVDRAAGDQFRAAFPGIVEVARASRAFHTHEVAQRVAPDSRIVYVDNDPLVLVQGRALLTSTPEGAATYVEADLYDPDTILREAARTLDIGRPVAVMLMGILGHVGDYDQARSIVRRLLDAAPSGSYLALNDGTDVIDRPAVEAAQGAYNQSGAIPYHPRSPAQIAGFFEGLELVEPGVVSCPRWRPDADGLPAEVDAFGGVGRKP